MIFPKQFLPSIQWSLYLLNADKLKMPQSGNFPITMLRPRVYKLQTVFFSSPFLEFGTAFAHHLSTGSVPICHNI